MAVMPIPLRVLVADDEPTVLAALGRVIGRQADMTMVANASDGLLALRLVAEHVPDVVVLDVGMPGLSGVDVARRLRAAGDTTPVLFLTGDPTAIDQTRGIEQCRVVLKAAVQISEVLDAVRQLVVEPSTAARTSRAPAGFNRKMSGTEVATSGRGSPDITTIRSAASSG